ncbi:hypothetical protein FRC03_005135 [Tulasnella sp. 419]|nr:hypothetical protein FRC03_005135 [Tulasnella sp. 419]
MLDVISVLNSQDYEVMIEEICDLWYQVVVQIKQLLEEGIAKNIIGNMVEIAIRDLQCAVTDYHQKFAETRYYSNFQENLTIGFLESVTRLLHELLGSTRLSGGEKPFRIYETIESIGRDTEDTPQIFQRISSQNPSICQHTSSKDEEAALNTIQPRVDSARYDSAPQLSSSFCLKDTRVALLKEIERWAEDPNSRAIFWLCGMAGTGKSTITRTVAKRFDDRGYLGASFFFSRDENDRRTANLVFPTIAYQLARRNPSLREHIVKAANPDVCTAMMRTQLNKLILEPLKHSNPQSSPLVIVMDALDECVDESQITEMLVLLTPGVHAIRKTINIKVFLTSRPEVHLSSEFREPGMEVVSSVSVLHDIEKSLVRDDIGRYIEHHLQRIAKRILPLHTIWPTSEEKEALIDMADGLFIFAAVTEETVEPILGPFHSVLYISPEPTPIRVFHKSFPDFLTDKRRSGGFWFHIDPIEHHARLALLCLTHMNDSLYRDMCGVGDRLVSELDNVESILQTKVQGHVLYACRYWASHLQEVVWTDELDAALKKFCEHKLLCWLEILCLDRKLDLAILALDSARKWTLDEASSTTLANGYRYVLYFRSTISLGPSHIYHSTLPFVPHYNMLESPWEKELHSSPRLVLTDGYDIWNRNLFTLTAHSRELNAVAYSPDGLLLASGSNDGKVIIWDSRTGAQVHSLEYPSNVVTAVAFSPDGSVIASGSMYGSVRIWNTATGILVHSLNGHSLLVTSVSFSPSGDVVVSGSSDRTVILWDSRTGSLIRILDSEFGEVMWATFSPHGAQIISWAVNSPIIIWDAQTGTVLSRLPADESREETHTVAISPDGALLASASGKDVVLWDYRSRKVLKRLKEDRGTVLCVAFSPDGRFLATGLDTGQITTWNATAGSKVGIFTGHISRVTSLAVSPDGSRLFSGSYDTTAVVWDMGSGWENPEETNYSTKSVHTGAVHIVAFSSDGNKLVSSAADHVVALWDIRGHALIHTLRGHSKSVTALAFSTDGECIASGSGDRRIIVWDVETGAPIKNLDLGIVQHLAFSPDGLYLVAAYQVRSRKLQWTTFSAENFEGCGQVPLTQEEAENLLSARDALPSGIYLAKDQSSDWVEKRCQGTTVERLFRH